uniref:Sushi domain-containing protein n=1 Tax=Syphacia muris TaxID=451379 RepID=A0A0N5AH21_9BILA
MMIIIGYKSNAQRNDAVAIVLYLLMSLIRSVAASCGAHPSVVGGDISYLQASLTVNYETGSTALLFCQPGRQVVGNTASVCGANGVWSPNLGSCSSASSAKTCSVLNSSLETQYASGTTAILGCHLGFVVSGASSSRCNDGVWTPAIGTCRSIYSNNSGSVKTCYEYPAIANGQIVYLHNLLNIAYSVGTIATLVCNAGYYPSGAVTAYCKDTGNWDTLGRCVKIGSTNTFYDECSEFKGIQNGHVSYDLIHPRRVGTIAALICDIGYVPSGTTILRCEETGQWSSTLGVCNYVFGGSVTPTLSPLPTQCPVLTVLNGQVAYDLIRPRSKGTLATLYCNAGYIISGNVVTICGENGQWSPVIGNCNLIGQNVGSSTSQCPSLVVANGSIMYDLIRPRAVGTSAILSCSLGYLPQGTTIVTCQQNGLWNGK